MILNEKSNKYKRMWVILILFYNTWHSKYFALNQMEYIKKLWKKYGGTEA